MIETTYIHNLDATSPPPRSGRREAYRSGRVSAISERTDGSVYSKKLTRQQVVNFLRFHYKGDHPFDNFKEETEPHLWADGRLTSLREEGEVWYYVLEQEWLD